MSKDIVINVSYIQRHENLLLREPKFEKSQIWKKPGKQPAFFKTAGFYWLFSNFWLFCQPWPLQRGALGNTSMGPRQFLGPNHNPEKIASSIRSPIPVLGHFSVTLSGKILEKDKKREKLWKRQKIKSKKIHNFFSVCDRKMGPPLFDRYFLALHAYQVLWLWVDLFKRYMVKRGQKWQK